MQVIYSTYCSLDSLKGSVDPLHWVSLILSWRCNSKLGTLIKIKILIVMITLNVNSESLEFANVAEVFNKDGNNTSRKFRNELFGSWLSDGYDSAIELAESVKGRISLLEMQLHNLNTLMDALKPEIAKEQYQLNLSKIENMDAAQLDALASAIAEQKAKLNS